MAGSDARDAIPAIVAGIAHAWHRCCRPSTRSRPSLGAIHRRSEDLRRTDMAKLASALARKTPLRKGMTRRRAAALVFVLTGPPSYQSFVLEARAGAARLGVLGHRHAAARPVRRLTGSGRWSSRLGPLRPPGMKKSRFPLHYRGSSGSARLARFGLSAR